MSPAAGRPHLVLASASPRRRELLAGLGLAVAVRPAAVDERLLPGEEAAAHVERLAREKAEAVAAAGELVVAADTVVTLDGEVLGKPADAADARAMLRRLQGREHRVLSGVAVRDAGAGRTAAEVEVSRVRLAPLSEREIDWYVATGEPLDKAGAYGVQGRAALFVAGIEGSWSNVVGLPLALLYRLVAELGHDLL
ncbi:MAG TPA: Maf family protein, partial [Thermoanaerobaculia bacterium]|nr:Maf family protein [Thermoanaerobaculia bacterium]